MSILMSVTTDPGVQTVASHVVSGAQSVASHVVPSAQEGVVVADGDIFSWVNEKANTATGTVKAVAVLVGSILALAAGWKAKGAIGGVVSGAVAAVLLIFAVANVGNQEVQDNVRHTVTKNGAGPIHQHSQQVPGLRPAA